MPVQRRTSKLVTGAAEVFWVQLKEMAFFLAELTINCGTSGAVPVGGGGGELDAGVVTLSVFEFVEPPGPAA